MSWNTNLDAATTAAPFDPIRRGEDEFLVLPPRAEDVLARMGLVADPRQACDPRDHLTDLSVGRTDPDTRPGPKPRDANWPLGRII
jgi:hypothetical protein